MMDVSICSRAMTRGIKSDTRQLSGEVLSENNLLKKLLEEANVIMSWAAKVRVIHS